jgi:lantibiotic biosynthesis protein
VTAGSHPAAVAGTGPWHGPDAERAAEFVSALADRLADPAALAATAATLLTRETGGWAPAGLAAGHPGLALFYGQLARTDERRAATAHEHLLASMRAIRTGPALGLCLGPASVALAAQTCGARDGDYAALRANLLAWVAQQQAARIEAALAALTPEVGVPEGTYDVITGITGLGRVLLDAVGDPVEDSPAVDAAMRSTLRYLVRLSETRTVGGREVPGWWTSPEQFPLDRDREAYPGGAANTGMAHGIAGPIALLSLAAQRDVLVPGQLDAIASLCDRLCGLAVSDQEGPCWPPRAVPPGDRAAAGPARTRDAWCYGAYGIAAALHRAGTALDRKDWRSLAVSAVRGASTHESLVLDPYLCHGFAGRLQVARRLGMAEGDGELLADAHRLAARLLDFVDLDAPFLVVAPAHDIGTDGDKLCHRPGMLDGAAGVGCALAALLAGETGAGERDWDRMLMLS